MKWHNWKGVHFNYVVKARLIPRNTWGNRSWTGGHLQWFNRQESLEHFNRCTPRKKCVPWKHLYFSLSFPAVSMYSSVKRSLTTWLIFKTLALTLPTTAVLGKISKQLVLLGRKKTEWNQDEPSFLTAQESVLAQIMPWSIAGLRTTEWNMWPLLLTKHTFQQARLSVVSLKIIVGCIFFPFLSPKHFLLISGLKN